MGNVINCVPVCLGGQNLCARMLVHAAESPDELGFSLRFSTTL